MKLIISPQTPETALVVLFGIVILGNWNSIATQTVGTWGRCVVQFEDFCFCSNNWGINFLYFYGPHALYSLSPAQSHGGIQAPALISFRAFCRETFMMSSWGQKFTTLLIKWLPLAVLMKASSLLNSIVIVSWFPYLETKDAAEGAGQC